MTYLKVKMGRKWGLFAVSHVEHSKSSEGAKKNSLGMRRHGCED